MSFNNKYCACVCSQLRVIKFKPKKECNESNKIKMSSNLKQNKTKTKEMISEFRFDKAAVKHTSPPIKI